MSVRPATTADLAVLVALDSYAADHADRAADIARWLQAGDVLVAERDGLPVGYCAVGHAFFGHDLVEMLMVAAPHRRAGVGRELLIATLAATRGKLFATTNRSNLPTQRVLLATGFVPSGVVENLDHGDPELIFVHLG